MNRNKPNPKSFRQLCADRKLFWTYSRSSQKRYFNKVFSRNVAEKLGVLVPELYWVIAPEEHPDFNDIRKSLPDQFVVKPTHGHSAQGVYCIANGVDLMSGKKFQMDAEITKLQSQKNTIFIEELIPLKTGRFDHILSYKVFYFGEEKIIRVNKDNYDHKKIEPQTEWHAFYTKKWDRLRGVHNYATEGPELDRPADLDTLMHACDVLGKHFGDFTRIDFYDSPKGWTFGEFSPFPFNGDGFTQSGSKMFANLWQANFDCNYQINKDVQRLSLEDHEIYSQIIFEYRQTTYPEKTFSMSGVQAECKRILSDPEQFVFAIFDLKKTKIIATRAYGKLRYKSGLKGKADCEVYNIYTSPAYRGLSLTKAIHREGLKKLRSIGYRNLAAFVMSTNVSQVEYYRSIEAKQVLEKHSKDWDFGTILVFQQSIS